MSYKEKITSTFNHPIVLCYRMPTNSEVKNPVLEINLAERALLVDVVFPSENHFNEFKLQNAHLIDSGRIILGRTTGTKAEKVYETETLKSQNATASKVDKKIEKLEEVVNTNTKKSKFKVEVEKEEV